MRPASLGLALVLCACNPEPDKGPAGGDTPGEGSGGQDPVETVPETPGVPDSVVIGDFDIKGRLLADRTDDTVGDGLCIDVVDQHDLALGREATVLASTTVDGAGAFTLADLPPASTTGFALRVQDCDGDASTWYPTMTLIPIESTAGLGPGEVLDGQVAWVVSTADARSVEAAMLENGAPSGLDEVGALMGQIFDTEGALLPLAALRGPDATRVHYDQGANIWLPYVNTSLDGDARFASPGAPWALWTCRAQAFNIPPVLAGAQPGWITRWDFRATEDFSSGG